MIPYLSRRAVVGGLVCMGGAGVAWCSGVNRNSVSPSKSPAVGTSPVPSLTTTPRPVKDVPLEPDSPPRGIVPTSSRGQDELIRDLTFSMPQGASVADVSDSDGRSIAEIKLVDTRGGVPSLRVRQVESYQRPLVSETYAQEVLLLTERRGNVRRTRESWPKTKEAYVITWDQDVTGSDGREILLSCVGFWLDNGRGGGWTLNGIAPRGQLDGSALWDLVFSVRLP